MHLKIYCQNIKEKWLESGKSNLDVFYGIANSFVDQIPVLYNYLSDYEMDRANRFRHESDYNCYVSVHSLLRIELSKILGTEARSIKIVESKSGKPFISDEVLPFSISRTKNSFAFVIGRSNQFLGVDIEQINPDVEFPGISRSFFSTKEQQRIFSIDSIEEQQRFFFEIWTRKEALLKALGVGINTELSNVQVLEGENIIDMEVISDYADSFKIITIMNDRESLSIASSVDIVPRFINISSE